MKNNDKLSWPCSKIEVYFDITKCQFLVNFEIKISITLIFVGVVQSDASFLPLSPNKIYYPNYNASFASHQFFSI